MDYRTYFVGIACVCSLAVAAAGCSKAEDDSTETGGADLSAQAFDCTVDKACEHSDVLGVCVSKIRIAPNAAHKDEVEVTTTPRSVVDEDPNGARPQVSSSRIAFRQLSSSLINITWDEGKFTGGVQADKSGQKFVGKLDINGLLFSGKLTCS